MITYPELPAGFSCRTEGANFIKVWDQARAGRLMPKRSDIKLSSLRSLTASTAFMDYKSPSEVLYGVTGSTICERLGFDPAGHNILDHNPRGHRKEIGRLWQAIVEKPCGAIMTAKSNYGSQHASEVDLLYLPLEGNKGEKMLIGFYMYSGKPSFDRKKERPVKASLIKDSFHFIDTGAGTPD